jgi:hypothetical protein
MLTVKIIYHSNTFLLQSATILQHSADKGTNFLRLENTRNLKRGQLVSTAAISIHANSVTFT